MNFSDPFAHGAYLLWDGGTLKFDTVDEETVERDAEIVEHPVETGANIADHYRIKLRNIKLQAFVSQEPVDPSLYPEAQGLVQGVEFSLPSYPAPSVAGLIATGAIATAFAKKPPTRFVQQALVYNNPIDTLASVLSTLEDLYANATLVDVATRSWYYASHLLGPVTTRRNEKTGSGTIIELELRQIVFVSTDAVTLPPTPVKKKDSPLKDKGKQNPTPPSLKSGFASLTDFLGGPLAKYAISPTGL